MFVCRSPKNMYIYIYYQILFSPPKPLPQKEKQGRALYNVYIVTVMAVYPIFPWGWFGDSGNHPGGHCNLARRRHERASPHFQQQQVEATCAAQCLELTRLAGKTIIQVRRFTSKSARRLLRVRKDTN